MVKSVMLAQTSVHTYYKLEPDLSQNISVMPSTLTDLGHQQTVPLHLQQNTEFFKVHL